MISRFAYYFEDDCKCEPMTSIQKRVHMFSDGQVRVDKKFESSGRENSDILFSLKEFATAYPVLAKEIFEWMRANHHDIKELEFPEHNDLVPVMKTCSVCHKEKPAVEFPVNDLSFEGTHKDCCECRIRECQEKKMKCLAPVLPRCLKIGNPVCPVFGERKQNWDSKEEIS